MLSRRCWGVAILHEFVTNNRTEIIVRCRLLIADLHAPRPTQSELEHGVPLFLDQLADKLRLKLTWRAPRFTRRSCG